MFRTIYNHLEWHLTHNLRNMYYILLEFLLTVVKLTAKIYGTPTTCSKCTTGAFHSLPPDSNTTEQILMSEEVKYLVTVHWVKPGFKFRCDYFHHTACPYISHHFLKLSSDTNVQTSLETTTTWTLTYTKNQDTAALNISQQYPSSRPNGPTHYKLHCARLGSYKSIT